MALNKIIDEDYLDLIMSKSVNANAILEEDITNLNYMYDLLHVFKKDIELCDLGKYSYARVPSLFVNNSVLSIEASGIGNVQRNPHLGLFGQGTLVGIIDTGIAYQIPAFLHRDGSSRIISIWDQTIESENVPDGFTFGTEYLQSDINLALKSPEPMKIVPVDDPLGHGTAIASIAAGSANQSESFSGVVPSSEIVVVKLKRAKKNLYKLFNVPEDKECYQESDIMLGIRYVAEIAQSLNRPIAICIALGTSQGGHDGFDALSTYIDYLNQLTNIGIAVSGGNEGNKSRHYYAEVNDETYLEEIELIIGEEDHSFSVEIWLNVTARTYVEVISPTGETTKPIYPAIKNCQVFTSIFHQGSIWVNNNLFEEETGDQLILIRFKNPLPGVWNIRMQSLENQKYVINAWLPAGNLISENTYFLKPDPYITITTPGNTRSPLTVTAYNINNNSILLESGRGYTRNNIVKPDLAAPGLEIPCALTNGEYGDLTGTGAATAHTTGAIAMVLEWADVKGNYTSITGNIIASLMVRSANQKEGYIYPNRTWGYGELDISNLFDELSLY